MLWTYEKSHWLWAKVEEVSSLYLEVRRENGGTDARILKIHGKEQVKETKISIKRQ